MIELPLDNTPSKEFSVNTPVGVLRFKTQWDSFLGQWFMDILSPTGETWLNRVSLTAGTDNLIDGCGIPELRDCALFAIDTNDVGVKANATVTVAHEITDTRTIVRMTSNGYAVWGKAPVLSDDPNYTYATSQIISIIGGKTCFSTYNGDRLYLVSPSGDISWNISHTSSGIGANLSGTGIYTVNNAVSGNNVNLVSVDGTVTGGFAIAKPSSTKLRICADDSGNFYVAGSLLILAEGLGIVEELV